MTDVRKPFNLEWHERAGCKGQPAHYFFPENKYGDSQNHRKCVAEARKICMKCPVAQQCFDYALNAEEEYGVWGGVDFYGWRMSGERRRQRLMKAYTKFREQYKKQHVIK